MLDEVDAVVVSLPPEDTVFGWDYPALRDLLQARAFRTSVCVAIRIRPLTAGVSRQLDALVSAESSAEARHG